jgi:V8-like Glu-specific endopeptidase
LPEVRSAEANGAEDVLDRVRRLCGNLEIQSAFRSMRQIIGPQVFPKGEELAAEAMAALREGKVPTPTQRAALEMAIKALRPSVLSQEGDLSKLPAYRKYPDEFLTNWKAFCAAVKPYLYSIGRIDRVDSQSDGALATGFVIGPGLLATNKHVLESLSAGTFKLERGQGVVRFGEEFKTVPDKGATAALTGVRAVHPQLDLTILEIENQNLPPLPVDNASPKVGAQVVVVGYPQDDARSPVFRDLIFEGRYKLKRAAPGEVIGTAPQAVFHDCSTLGGNSGSPLLAMGTGRVVGLHRDGPLFLYRNEAVDCVSLGKFVALHLS